MKTGSPFKVTAKNYEIILFLAYKFDNDGAKSMALHTML